MTSQPVIALAGASGDLGFRIAQALIRRGAAVRAPVRPDISPVERARLEAIGLTVIPANPGGVTAMAGALAGSACVVSALNGLQDTMVGRQGVLLEAAVRAGVPRFIPSDFSADFTKTKPGLNRNFDIRREFMRTLDLAPIKATSILNGAFLDMLGAEMPLIQPAIRRVLYWHSAEQLLDFTSKDNVAAYTAAVATDDAAPRILRIAGDAVSVKAMAAVMSEATGQRYRPLRAGGLVSLGMMIRIAKFVAPQRHAPFPPWQGMQYMRDQFSGRAKLDPLDNERYPGMLWTRVQDHLSSKFDIPV